MKDYKNKIISLDKFIESSLYDKRDGYYMSKDPFGKKGDFITSSNISIFFSEMLAIWILSFWEKLNKPKKINIIDVILVDLFIFIFFHIQPMNHHKL